MSLVDILRINNKYKYTMLSYAYISLVNDIDIDDLIFGRLNITDVDVESFMNAGLINQTQENLDRLRYGKLGDIDFNNSFSTNDNALIGEFMASQQAFLSSLQTLACEEESTNKKNGEDIFDTEAFVNVYNWVGLYGLAKLKLGMTDLEFWVSGLGELRTCINCYSLIESGNIKIITVKETQYVKELDSTKYDVIQQALAKRKE